MITKAQQRAVHKYVKTHYEQVNIAVKKGVKDEWKQSASALGYDSLTKFIADAVAEKIGRG